MSKLDTNQASELFELCKEVYERTMWDGDIADWGDNKLDKYGQLVPKYTSDYLLEKLPKGCSVFYSHIYQSWEALGHESFEGDRQNADTPLKALLHLAIALSEAGELK